MSVDALPARLPAPPAITPQLARLLRLALHTPTPCSTSPHPEWWSAEPVYRPGVTTGDEREHVLREVLAQREAAALACLRCPLFDECRDALDHTYRMSRHGDRIAAVVMAAEWAGASPRLWGTKHPTPRLPLVRNGARGSAHEEGRAYVDRLRALDQTRAVQAYRLAERERDARTRQPTRAPSPGGRPVQPCGTRAAYLRHVAAGERPCDPCTEAERQQHRARRARARAAS